MFTFSAHGKITYSDVVTEWWKSGLRLGIREGVSCGDESAKLVPSKSTKKMTSKAYNS